MVSLCSAAAGIGMSGLTEEREEYSGPAGVCATADPVAQHVDSPTLTYERFIEYGPAERAIITSRGNEDLRSMLRSEHLARAAQDDRFSSEQKAVIGSVRAWYEQHPTDRGSRAEQALETAVSNLFSREEAWFAFRLLGSSDLSDATAPPDDVIPWCSCRNIGDCVSPDDLSSRCRAAFCIPNISCGPDGRFWCFGECT